MVGKGRASHVGLGDGDVLRAVVNETKLPPDKEADTDGNRHFYASSASASATAGTPGPRRRRRPSRRSRPRSAATMTGANAPSSATRSGSRASRTRAAHDGRHALPHREPPAGQAGRRRRLCPPAPAPARVRGAPGRRFLPDRPPRSADHRHGQAPGRGGLRPLRGGPEPRPPTIGQTVALPLSPVRDSSPICRKKSLRDGSRMAVGRWQPRPVQGAGPARATSPRAATPHHAPADSSREVSDAASTEAAERGTSTTARISGETATRSAQ